jgi:hypothetical protein
MIFNNFFSANGTRSKKEKTKKRQGKHHNEIWELGFQRILPANGTRSVEACFQYVQHFL